LFGGSLLSIGALDPHGSLRSAGALSVPGSLIINGALISYGYGNGQFGGAM
jgi:hypothetical protein